MSTIYADLQGKVAVITGASAGIGEAIALEFARNGCHMTICGRNQQRLDQVKDKCLQQAKGHIKVVSVCGDVVNPEHRHLIIDETCCHFGKIDILVNNAGVTLVRSPTTAELSDYKHIMDTNMESVFFLTKLAIPHLIKTQGNIINMSSIASNKGIAQYVIYAMSKAALDSYTKSLSLFLAPHKVRVNSVNPGSVESLLYKRGKDALTDDEYEQFKSKQASSSLHPLGRMVKASEVADATAFLVSDKARFITGQILFVDGGRNNVCAQPRL